MKLFRIIATALFALTLVTAAAIFIKEFVQTDRTMPVITVDENMIEVSLKATDEELLKGVTAYDEKDKDLTDNIIIESISRFIEPGVSKVTYTVCDKDNNVAKATRLIKYVGYEAPKFQVSGNLCFSIFEHIDIKGMVTATDSLEGDISGKAVITSENYTSSISGAFSLDVTVTNQKGDTSTITLPLIVEDRPISVPTIELKEYLVYADVGQEIDFRSYITGVFDTDRLELNREVSVESNVDFKTPGTYHVHYYVTNANGLRGHSVLTVIVEE